MEVYRNRFIFGIYPILNIKFLFGTIVGWHNHAIAYISYIYKIGTQRETTQQNQNKIKNEKD
jgi:hypothetical protein